jgi:hypothetical protein
MTDNEAAVLIYWRDFLIAQRAHIKKSYTEQTGTAYDIDEVKAAFLVVDEKMTKEEIEKALEAFIHDASWPPQWPPLNPRECLHLDFRAHVGLTMIANIVRETPLGLLFKKGMLWDLENFRNGVRWLFLHFWKIGGQSFLTTMADDFLREELKKHWKTL